MNKTHDAALAARQWLATQGWIARDAEAFRHLPPPQAAVWLGDLPAATGAVPTLEGAGWTLHPLQPGSQDQVSARWLDAHDGAQRAELLAGLPQPGDIDPGDAIEAAPFAWAHRALCRHGLRLRIGGQAGASGGPQQVVWLQLRHQPRSAVEAPLLVVEVLAGTHCVLVETHDKPASTGQPPLVQNLQVHLRLGQGASLQHLRVATPGAADRLAHHVHARLEQDARYEQASIGSGSSYHLQRSLIELQAEGAEARSAGLWLAAGTALEHQVRISHRAARTLSALDDLALASGPARMVLNARSLIAPGAAQADVHQRLTGIPTGGQPKLVLRPHLEVLHDQVQANHGATWGALPEDALFYARQRGLDERSARGLIVEGMADALMQRGFPDAAWLQALGIDALLRDAVAQHLAVGQEASHG